MTIKIIRVGIFSRLLACYLPAIGSEAYVPPLQPGPFNADAASLQRFRTPDWFRDAKFGIWSHWGPQAVPRRISLEFDRVFQNTQRFIAAANGRPSALNNVRVLAVPAHAGAAAHPFAST